MTKYKKGTVVLVLFPNSDLVTAKRRPALVVQADELDTGLEQVIVAMQVICPVTDTVAVFV